MRAIVKIVQLALCAFYAAKRINIFVYICRALPRCPVKSNLGIIVTLFLRWRAWFWWKGINPSVTETIKMCQCDDERFYHIVLKTLL